MSEDEARRANEEETGDVEAHARKAAANEEAPDEARRLEDDDNDVEGHARRAAPDAEGGRTA